MPHLLLTLLLMFYLMLPAWGFAMEATPQLMLANSLSGEIHYSQYWFSEKLDGVRGFWNGEQMVTRSGREIRLPYYLLASFTEQPVEGELWLGRGRFDEVSALIRRDDISDPLWQEVSFVAFDLPTHAGVFHQRVNALKVWQHQVNNPAIKVVEHVHFEDSASADQYLQQLVADGAEGLMLNRVDARYQAGRSNALLKLKPSWDAEAQIIGYSAGKGKYQGMVGALIVRREDGAEFKIGSGLSDALRQTPPEIGTWITYEYSGFTSNGLPRFARYLRAYHRL